MLTLELVFSLLQFHQFEPLDAGLGDQRKLKEAAQSKSQAMGWGIAVGITSSALENITAGILFFWKKTEH